MSKKNTYQASLEELEAIIASIENEDVGIDDLSTKVKRAAILLKQCQSKLRKTEEDIDGILENIR